MVGRPVRLESGLFMIPEGEAMGLILLIILILLLAGSVPAWPYSRTWGYRPSSLLSVLLVLLIVLLLFNVVPWWGYPGTTPPPP
jgi:hypothetical protein